MGQRREFGLPSADEEFLVQYGLPWETVINGSRWVLIHDFPAPPGYQQEMVSIALRIESGYPVTQLDMVYVHPHLQRRDGKPIPKTNACQPLESKTWQRWSRHRSAENPWRPGVDGIETHVYLVEDWFSREFER